MIAKSAYRAAEAIKSDHDGIIYDYSRKRGIVHKEILLPENAPVEYADRSVLWNAVEESERNSNAQLAREIEVSLPVELSREQNIKLVRDYVKRHFVDQVFLPIKYSRNLLTINGRLHKDKKAVIV